MTHADSTPATPIPPGWPDPLESPQAEAIRNGKLDDTEIRNLFDCMERELRLHRERAANPAQGVSATVDELFANCDKWGALEWFNRLAMAIHNRDNAVVEGNDLSFATFDNIAKSSAARLVHDFEAETRAALTATIGAGEQAVAFASRQSGILDFDVNGAEIINVLLHPKGTLRPENEIPLYAHPVQPGWRECATDGCVSPATIHFARGGVGSYYCYSCYCKIQALPTSRAALADGGRDAG